MSKLSNKEVANDNINIQTDMGKCQACKPLVFIYSEHFDTPAGLYLTLNQPPKGPWYKNNMQGNCLGQQLRKSNLMIYWFLRIMILNTY